ncbi:MAG: serine O-acetyltransferase [Lentisphaeria bacterium]|nr:serine O-acetyltransferase [Lentisphaeria bacterium]NQZ66529.1 serine O-acetyltransferase [Lentisphaeria bacterium]
MNALNIWQEIQSEAKIEAANEPLLSSFLETTILNHTSFEQAISFHLANKLQSTNLNPSTLIELYMEAFNNDPSIIDSVIADILAIRERDPACKNYSTPLLYFKGFQALTSHRIAHWFWNNERQYVALFLQSRVSEVFTVDMHPAAKIGKGILIDHAHGIVVGETAVIEDNVSILHDVTLGGTGKEAGDRHPKIGKGVLIGVGAKLLGNITVGEGSKIGAGSVVLNDIPPHSTAVGIPAKVVGTPQSDQPALNMNHNIDLGAGI